MSWDNRHIFHAIKPLQVRKICAKFLFKSRNKVLIRPRLVEKIVMFESMCMFKINIDTQLKCIFINDEG